VPYHGSSQCISELLPPTNRWPNNDNDGDGQLVGWTARISLFGAFYGITIKLGAQSSPPATFSVSHPCWKGCWGCCCCPIRSTVVGATAYREARSISFVWFIAKWDLFTIKLGGALFVRKQILAVLHSMCSLMSFNWLGKTISESLW